ncbi:hypothetical protein ACFUO0_17605 [Streptomyces cinereoruber]|uniref:hypothetical protein n=1 Tax=Streptomyces cinereoruber TaxID=67260 RepID=UPI00363E4A9F
MADRTLLDEDVHAGFAWIAARLTTVRPDDEMTPNARQMLAMRYAEDTHGHTGAGGFLYGALLERLPAVDRDLTRGEYALIVRRAEKVGA